eukprot:TRINITY_DN9506_c0_g1_i1.p1 TRINITY_DN9506_c0_g1~~TRINITY_DN9506_c0_g1_i1.p1  ORF type:complete len:366 (-),score=69.22 TRINITY_DN9506_c0_g1_i1:67-1116(-)
MDGARDDKARTTIQGCTVDFKTLQSSCFAEFDIKTARITSVGDMPARLAMQYGCVFYHKHQPGVKRVVTFAPAFEKQGVLPPVSYCPASVEIEWESAEIPSCAYMVDSCGANVSHMRGHPRPEAQTATSSDDSVHIDGNLDVAGEIRAKNFFKLEESVSSLGERLASTEQTTTSGLGALNEQVDSIHVAFAQLCSKLLECSRFTSQLADTEDRVQDSAAAVKRAEELMTKVSSRQELIDKQRRLATELATLRTSYPDSQLKPKIERLSAVEAELKALPCGPVLGFAESKLHLQQLRTQHEQLLHYQRTQRGDMRRALEGPRAEALHLRQSVGERERDRLDALLLTLANV